jgi:hypothetical protein
MTIHLKLKPETVAALNELAGGERHKSAYIERMVSVLHGAKQAAQQQQAQLTVEALAAVLTQEPSRE